MLKKMDSQRRGLLWFLFQPEDSPGFQHLKADHRRFGNGLNAAYNYREGLKSVVWIIVSIVLSLTIAHLK